MKIAKKTLTITSLVTLIIAVGMLILAIFNIPIFKNPNLQILLSFSSICVGAIFALNGLQIFNKRKKLSIVDLSLIGTLVVFGLLTIWLNKWLPDLFVQIFSILALATIFFNIIVSNYLRLGRTKLVLQTLTYVLIIVIDILISLQILGVNLFNIDWFVKLFVVLCLVAFVLLVVLVVLAKKIPENDLKQIIVAKEQTITISKQEYEDLLSKIATLEEENKKLKQTTKIHQN